MRTNLRTMLTVVLAVSLFWPMAARASVGPESDTDDVYWDDAFIPSGVVGNVEALARGAAGEVYVGGDFTMAGSLLANGIAKWDGHAWSALGSGINGMIFALAVDSAGNVYAGGELTTAGGVAAGNIAKWDGHAWSALGEGTNGRVSALVFDNAGNLYAGGEFSTSGGISVGHIAKWDGAAWSPCGTGEGMNYDVNALSTDSVGNLYAGGVFTTVDGAAMNRVAKWDGTAWTPLGSGVDDFVWSLATDSAGNLYAGGNFDTAGGVAASRIAKWDGATWAPVGGGTGSSVMSMVFDASGNLYAGGLFNTIGGVTANYVAKWDGTAWTPFGAGVSGSVNAVVLDGTGNLYVGGHFNIAGGVVAVGIAKWDGAAWSSCGTGAGISGHVMTFAKANGGILYASGYFTTAGAAVARSVARWDGAAWAPLGEGITGNNNTVRASVMDRSGSLCLGGYFSTTNGSPFDRVAKWDGAAWGPLALGLNSTVGALATDSTGNMYAGGYFTASGSVAVNRIAKWDGAAWTPLGEGLNSACMSIATDNEGNVYAGGSFTMAGGVAANRIAKWDGAAWTPLGEGIGSPVFALATDNAGNLYAGGSFTTAGGVAANRIAKWDGAVWTPLGEGVDGQVNALVTDNAGNVYAGGTFTTAGGVAANNLAKWDGSAWSALGSGTDNTVQTLSLEGNALFVGGQQRKAGGKESRAISLWQPRVNQSTASLSETPGVRTLGNDRYGFYKPALTTDASTTVAYDGDLPVDVTLDRADEILVDGKRINGAFTLGPEEVQFGGSAATLRVEFSEDDAAAFGVAYTEFRAAKLTYPADYPTNKEAAAVSALGPATPEPIRIENGKQIYAISVPLTAIGSTYGAAPQSLIAPPPPSNPGALVGQNAITWTWAWTDHSNGQAGFKVFADPGAAPPATLQATLTPGAASWRHEGLTPNCRYAFQVAAANGVLDSARTVNLARYTLAGPPSVGNNVACDKTVNTPYGPGAACTFTNPNGFGAATHGGSAYKVSLFRYAWDTSETHIFSGGESFWNAGALVQFPSTSGAYFLHLQSLNADGYPSATLDHGPFLFDADPPVPIITGATTLTHTVRTLTIDFGEHVNGFSLPSDVLVVNGTASNLQATANPGEYTVDILGTGVNTVSVFIPEGAASDDATNPNNEMAAPFTFPFDGVAPSAAITLMDEAETGLHEVHFRVLFSEPLPFPLSAGDVSLTEGSLAGTIGVEEINTAQFTVTVALQDPKAQGTVGITLTPGAVTDEAGNPNEGALSPLYTIQGVALPAAGLAGLASLLGLITLTAAKKLRARNR